jgi:serine/threonine-protein kinase
MSPEQCRGAGQVDQRSDIYSLGCVLMKLVTRQAPFHAAGTGELIAMHLREAPPMLSTRIANIPPELDALISRCLEKDPARRFANGSELASAIEQLLAQSSYAAMPATIVAVAAAHSKPTTVSSACGVTSSPRRAAGRRTRAIAVVGALVGGGGGLAVVLLTGGKHASARAPETDLVPTAAAPAVPGPVATVPAAAQPPAAVVSRAPVAAVPPPAPVAAVPPSAPVVSPAPVPPASATVANAKGSTAAPARPPALPTKHPGHGGQVTKPTAPADDGFIDLDGDGIPDKR